MEPRTGRPSTPERRAWPWGQRPLADPPRRRLWRKPDGFDLFMNVLGVLFFAIGLGSIVVVVLLIANFSPNPADIGFHQAPPAFQQVLKGLGIGLFASLAVAALGTADWLLAGAVRRRLRRWFRRS